MKIEATTKNRANYLFQVDTEEKYCREKIKELKKEISTNKQIIKECFHGISIYKKYKNNLNKILLNLDFADKSIKDLQELIKEERIKLRKNRSLIKIYRKNVSLVLRDITTINYDLEDCPDVVGYCPTCSSCISINEFVLDKIKCCSKCGQKIKWQIS